MSVAIITGAGGLIGAEAARFFSRKGLVVVGIDNDMRARFFGPDASTRWSWQQHKRDLPFYTHFEADIRDAGAIESIFVRYGRNISVVVHAAAQPSHDWAAREPLTDFSVNANGTLILLEAARQHCPEAAFIFCSTNKVYGDTPNRLPLEEGKTRWEPQDTHPFAAHGVDESMSIDASKHSLFGVSKCAADLMVQEYGRYFGMKTACFRGGCLTGPGHSGAQLHGFLSYLVKCAVTGERYTVFGYKGKQVRDNIHSHDVCTAIMAFAEAPRPAAVYNLGGGRENSVSMLEAIERFEELYGRKLEWEYVEEARQGDHICYISDLARLRADYPAWELTLSLDEIFDQFAATAPVG